jgi:hypothetical protein
VGETGGRHDGEGGGRGRGGGVRLLRVHGGVHGAVHRRRARAVRRAVDLRPVRGRGRRGARPRFPAHLARRGARPPRLRLPPRVRAPFPRRECRRPHRGPADAPAPQARLAAEEGSLYAEQPEARRRYRLRRGRGRRQLAGAGGELLRRARRRRLSNQK